MGIWEVRQKSEFRAFVDPFVTPQSQESFRREPAPTAMDLEDARRLDRFASCPVKSARTHRLRRRDGWVAPNLREDPVDFRGENIRSLVAVLPHPLIPGFEHRTRAPPEKIRRTAAQTSSSSGPREAG